MTQIEKLEKQLKKLVEKHGTGGAEHIYISESQAYSDEKDGYWLIVNWAGSEDKEIKPVSESVPLGDSYKEAKTSLDDYFNDESDRQLEHDRFYENDPFDNEDGEES